MHSLLEAPQAIDPRDQLQAALQQGNPIEAAYITGIMDDVTDITLPEHRLAWPAETTYTKAGSARDEVVASMDACHPDFYGLEATAYAQGALNVSPAVTPQLLQELAFDRSNTESGQMQARTMLQELMSHKLQLQAAVAASRVGWSAIVDGHFVACPPNGDVIFGRTKDAAALQKFLLKNNYRALPVDEPHAQPLIELLGRRTGQDAETIRGRGMAVRAKTERAMATQLLPVDPGLERTRIDMPIGLDHTLVDPEALASVRQEASIIFGAQSQAQAEAPALPMTTFAFVVAVGRLATSLFPDTTDAVSATQHHLLTAQPIDSAPQYTADQLVAITRAFREVARRPAMNDEARAVRQEAEDVLTMLDAWPAH